MVANGLDPNAALALEDAGDKFGVLLLDVHEELDGQGLGPRGKHRLGPVRGVEAVGRPAWQASLLAGVDVAGRPQRREVLAGSAGRDCQRVGELVRGGFTMTLQHLEDTSLCW
jgi:hypothetical protein